MGKQIIQAKEGYSLSFPVCEKDSQLVAWINNWNNNNNNDNNGIKD